MGDRRQARELALQALFFLDTDAFDPEKGDEERIRRNVDAFCINNEARITPEVEPFFRQLIAGVIDNQTRIDHLLSTYSKNWKLSRMPKVDRNIMRIATYEFLECPDIPESVTINEAVEIGKKYGTRDSGPFINGVLDRIRTLESSN